MALDTREKLVAAPVEADAGQQGWFTVAWIARITGTIPHHFHTTTIAFNINFCRLVDRAIALITTPLAAATFGKHALDAAAQLQKTPRLFNPTPDFGNALAAIANRTAVVHVGSHEAGLLNAFHLNGFHVNGFHVNGWRVAVNGGFATFERPDGRIELVRGGRGRKRGGNLGSSQAIPW
jgi:hypothetical protein